MVENENIDQTPRAQTLNQPALNQPALTQPALTQPALTQPALTQPALTQPGTQLGTDSSAADCVLANILGFMLPFFLVSAGGNADLARSAIKELIDAYQASTPLELDLVGRIIGFSTAALDNLRLSMTPELPDTKVLRYRSNAVTLSRASDQALKILEAVQARQAQNLKIPRPSVAAASPTPARGASPEPQPISLPSSPRSVPSATNGSVSEFPPADIETMKRDARIMMAAFSKNGAQGGSTSPAIPDPAVAADATARAAIASARSASQM
jgi:hypothetical protein